MSPRHTPLRVVARVVVAILVTAGVLAAPTVPAHAIRIPETLAHNVAVGNAPVTPGFAIEYLGVIWDGEHGEASARFQNDGRWGPWIDLEEDGAQAVGQYGTQLVNGNRADAYQVRVPGFAKNARAVAINVHDGPKKTVSYQPPAAGTAGAATNFVTRAEWGANEDLRFKDGQEIWPPTYYDVQKLTVHHTATKNDDPDPVGTVQAIYRYHAVDKGWGDIGYQYLIDEAGNTYEGRWSGDDGDVAHNTAGDLVTAAHVGGYNSGNAGVALLGDFRRVAPKAAAQTSLENVLAELAGRHNINPEGVSDFVNPVNGAKKENLPNIPAHKDWESTACPGTKLYDLLPTIRKNVSAKLSGSTTAPAAPTNLSVNGVTSSSVTLSWTDNSTDETGFDVERDGTVVATVAANSVGFEDIALQSSTTYSYRVRAVNSTAGTASSWAGPVSATTTSGTTTEPAAEFKLSASGTKVKGLQKVDLAWENAPASTVDIYWSDGSSDLVYLTTVAESSTYRHHIDRNGKGSYTYELRSGTSVSNRVTVTFA